MAPIEAPLISRGTDPGTRHEAAAGKQPPGFGIAESDP